MMILTGAIDTTAKGYGIDQPGYRLDDVPSQFWRKIELTLLDGKVIVLIYDHEPPRRGAAPGDVAAPVLALDKQDHCHHG
jgi:hypothetical protein